MAPYHWRARYPERSKCGVVRRVREVDEDAETIEFPHEGLAEWAVQDAESRFGYRRKEEERT